MGTFEQKTADFKEINQAAWDLLKTTSQQWLDMINKSLGKPVEAKESGTPRAAADILKLWSSGILNGNGQRAGVQQILESWLKQQQSYSHLMMSYFTSTAKMMAAIRKGAQNHHDSAETMKICKDLAAEYCRSCADFIESECARICDVLRSQESGAAKSEKGELVKTKAKTQKK